MNIGFFGLGKLGLPVAYTLAAAGHEIYGYDPEVWREPVDTGHERDLAPVIAAGRPRMHFCDAKEAAAQELVFVAVQTPHGPEYEGVTRLPGTRQDFDYSHLKGAVATVARWSPERLRTTLAVISTVLPGTLKREVAPLLSEGMRLAYNPSFIAMGTTIRDFRDPEFVLVGEEEPGEGDLVVKALSRVISTDAPIYRTTIPSAELAKVAYNTFIGLKLAFANTLQEVCAKSEADVDEVMDALFLGHRRIISPAYMRAGMGDGGACHPRDNIALSWIARNLNISYDLFESVMLQRERHADWLAGLLCNFSDATRMPMAILGYAYKAESALTAGSHALLVARLIRERGRHITTMHDPYASRQSWDPDSLRKSVFLIGCRHPDFYDLKLPAGSVVLDPWRDGIADQPGVDVVRLGAANMRLT